MSESQNNPAAPNPTPPRSRKPLLIFSWAWVAIPFSYGMWRLLVAIPALFG